MPVVPTSAAEPRRTGVVVVNGASAPPLDEQQVDLLPLLSDQIYELPSLASAECSAPDCSGRVALVVRLTIPRSQLQDLQHLAVSVQALVWQCSYLRDRDRIRDDPVHLLALPLAD